MEAVTKWLHEILESHILPDPRVARGGFFSESAMKFFQIFKSQKKYSKKTILSLKFKFPANNSKVLLAGNLNFKLRIVFWNIFF